MDIIKRIGLTVFGLLKQLWLIPQSVTSVIEQRRRRIARNELEIERLDRIRNPSKYVGK